MAVYSQLCVSLKFEAKGWFAANVNTKKFKMNIAFCSIPAYISKRKKKKKIGLYSLQK